MHRETPSPRGACSMAPVRVAPGGRGGRLAGEGPLLRASCAQHAGAGSPDGRLVQLELEVVQLLSLVSGAARFSAVTPTTEGSVGRGVLCVVSPPRGTRNWNCAWKPHRKS